MQISNFCHVTQFSSYQQQAKAAAMISKGSQIACVTFFKTLRVGPFSSSQVISAQAHRMVRFWRRFRVYRPEAGPKEHPSCASVCVRLSEHYHCLSRSRDGLLRSLCLSVSLAQLAHAHAVARPHKHNGGCLDAVKSCF